ncbi:hypothetical protein BG53_03555 [Paenibacillus darwinianus]|uniref:Uncharacterized protein n=1 Tax=Paenibacillus darwinianus TaxID=1380763 RepID=A0A9W5W7C4_9BACL|nr:hypothetical protein [Paenibacillus darwinianus]EXX87713.1 hypothetical protein BG53_03555 [Paenibacillus darwinianus]
MNDKKSRCAVERTALVIRREGESLWLRANGKDVRLDAGRAEGGTAAGDTVKWDGRRWTIIR